MWKPPLHPSHKSILSGLFFCLQISHPGSNSFSSSLSAAGARHLATFLLVPACVFTTRHAQHTDGLCFAFGCERNARAHGWQNGSWHSRQVVLGRAVSKHLKQSIMAHPLHICRGLNSQAGAKHASHRMFHNNMIRCVDGGSDEVTGGHNSPPVM